MNSLQITFDPADTTERGCIFVYRAPRKKGEVYIRAKVANPSNQNAGLARLFLTRIERVEPHGQTVLITDDTLYMNWALSAGTDREFYPSFEHYADILTFTEGAKFFKPMTTRAAAYWKEELQKPGIYRLHLLLTGPQIKAQHAILEMRWPMKKIEAKNFSFSVAG